MKNILRRVSIDGTPEAKRPFIAYSEYPKEYGIFSKVDKAWIKKQGWDQDEDAKDHMSPDGEYYSGENGWIYAIKFDAYIYADELGLKEEK